VTAGTTAQSLELRADQAGLVLVDWQERLVAAMPPQITDRAIRNAVILVEAARRLGLPIIASEQYPKGLGPTVAPLRDALSAAPGAVRFEKVDFSCAGVPEFDRAVAASARRQWIVAGMETHVCLYQTGRALAARSCDVFVPADAALSRSKNNFKIGLALLERAGCVIASTETIVFDLLKRAGGDQFKALSALLK
jgi:nicotinamidase-related amidase